MVNKEKKIQKQEEEISLVPLIIAKCILLYKHYSLYCCVYYNEVKADIERKKLGICYQDIEYPINIH